MTKKCPLGFVAILMFSFATLFSCKSSSKITDAPRPLEQYNHVDSLPLVSNIAVPIYISIDDLVRNLNISLSSKALYEDYSYEDNGKDDLMLNAWKSQDITMYVSGNTVKYRVPVSIWVKKRLFVGEAEANGELALSFKTLFQINPDWSLTTKTDVEYHEWLKAPVLKTGLGNISIESVANLALNRSKRMLSETLDRVVNQQLSLKPYVEEVWNAVQTPVLLSEEYKMWVKTTPLSIGMTALETDTRTIKTTVEVKCNNDVTFGEKPTFRENSKVPNLTRLNTVGDDFQMQFATDVPFPEAERIAKGMMLGQVFESNGKKVKIDDLKIWGNNDRLIVLSQLSGAFNGKIYFMGKPRYNALKNTIEVADLDFHVDSRNMLYKSASWLFQGPIKKQMVAAMTFPLDENLTLLKQSVQETLNHYEIQPGVLLTGTLEDIKVLDTRLSPTGIRVDIYSKGRINVDIK
jgi:Domain of unknown function (DUF4403)